MSEELRSVITPEALDTLLHAHQADPGYNVIVGNGDLSQLGLQYRFLKGRGFDVGRLDVYPSVRDEATKVLALRALWKVRVAGWWNLREDLLKAKICTATEYQDALLLRTKAAKATV